MLSEYRISVLPGELMVSVLRIGVESVNALAVPIVLGRDGE